MSVWIQKGIFKPNKLKTFKDLVSIDQNTTKTTLENYIWQIKSRSFGYWDMLLVQCILVRLIQKEARMKIT
jgi:hypothetical protein